MFIPERVIFEKDSLDYPLGEKLYNDFKSKDEIDIMISSINKVKSNIPGDNLKDRYKAGKRTLVVGVKKSLKFQSCKPSANYQLPLVSGCIGQCEYCYLNTQLGDKPFVRVHVNIEAILTQAKKYIMDGVYNPTVFEGAATSDPIPVEGYTQALQKSIIFFGETQEGRFRFVTKYNDVDSLLDLHHNNHTEIRFSLNTNRIIKEYEHGTASIAKRIEACSKLASSKYPIGFIIAPVFIYPGWRDEYYELLVDLKNSLPSNLEHPLSFEVISHRYTTRAKNIITEVFEDTTLPMIDEDRKFKYGQFGYGKYVYPKENLDEMKIFFQKELKTLFPDSIIKYII